MLLSLSHLVVTRLRLLYRTLTLSQRLLIALLTAWLLIQLLLIQYSNQSNTLTKQRPQTKSAVFFFCQTATSSPPRSGTRRPRVWRQSTVVCDFTSGPDPSTHCRMTILTPHSPLLTPRIQHIITVTQILEPVLADTLQVLNRHTTGDVAIFRHMLCHPGSFLFSYNVRAYLDSERNAIGFTTILLKQVTPCTIFHFVFAKIRISE